MKLHGFKKSLPFLLLLVLPIGGVWVSGGTATRYLEFPPLTQHVEHAEFSWTAFTLLAAATLALVIPIFLCLRKNHRTIRERRPAQRPFPWWSWLGLAFGGLAWVLAWTRFPWFAPLQRYTFTPLWLAYVVVINALTFRRSGRCLLTERPVYLLSLFPVSAVFWWFFEYLNRFVQNWYYVGIDTMTGPQYFVMATLPFSTVLPAVTSTFEWLRTEPESASAPATPPPVTRRTSKTAAGVILLLACTGLAGVGCYPNLFFPLVWIAPLLLLTSVDTLFRGHSNPPIEAFGITMQPACLWAVAALICGFFWELWNYYSLAKWIYTVPYVNRFPLFEMPVLGYAGYLPFGLECAVIAKLVENMTSSSHTKG